MSQKQVLIILLFCFIHTQLIACESLQEIISDFQPQLQQLRYKVRTAAATTNIRLGIANAYVSDRISISIANVQQQLETLQKNVQQAQEGSSSNENLEACLIDEQQAISSVNTEEFSACKRNEEIADLRRKVVALKGLLAEIDQTVTACLVDAGVNTEALAVCLQESIDAIGGSLVEQENAIGNGIDEIIIGSDKCASKVENLLEERIAEVAKEFLRCIGGTEENAGLEDQDVSEQEQQEQELERDSDENEISNED